MELRAGEVIKRPLVTEQGLHLVESKNIYPFEVDKRANKIQIRNAVEELFKVKVVSVNTAHRQGKRRRLGRRVGQRASWKKAYVKLAEGDKIELF
jgi:large subunit ribosomal protein L23